MTMSRFAINGLNPLARRIAMFLHQAHGIVRLETLRAMAEYEGQLPLLAPALQQLEEFQQATSCPHCDALLTECSDPFCRLHADRHWKTGHLPDCPRTGKKTVVSHRTPAARRKQA